MIKGGPKIETSGLQLYYDVDNIDSYPGEPTTNYCYTGGSWSGDGGAQAIGAKGSVEITDPNLMYNGYRTVLWTPGTSHNCYLNGSNDFDLSATSTQWAWSCYIKRDDGGTISSMSSYMYYPSSDGSGGCTVTPMGDRWYRISRLRTGTSNVLSLIGFTSMASEHKYYLSGWQLEKKTHLTQYADLSSTRSTTNGLKDLSGQGNHGDLANATYDSNALLDLDGSAGYFVPSSTINLPANANWTVGMWVKTGESCYLLSNLSGGPVANSLRISGGKINYYHYNSGWLSESGTSTVNDNVWHYLVWVNHIGSTIDLYVDGIGENMGDDSAGPITGPLDVFGKNWSTDYMDGKINVIQYWNSTDLTSTQVLNNYNAMKSRFGH